MDRVLRRAPRQGNRYARKALDVGGALPRLQAAGLTITPLLAAAAGRALAEHPHLAARVALGAVRTRSEVVVSIVVALGDGDNLAVVRVVDAHRKSVRDVDAELQEGAARLRAGGDEDFEQSMRAVRQTPMALLKPGLAATGWLSGALGITNRPLGLHADPLGSLCLSNIGGLGLDEAFSPPTPFAFAPIDLLVGSVADRPVVRDGVAVVRPMLTVNVTADARVANWPAVDGFLGALGRHVEDGGLLDAAGL
jgi:pyruvate/2-oxoglutarate dehydrogenase complex dihydrolipoamide acyltransferase (E2) component